MTKKPDRASERLLVEDSIGVIDRYHKRQDQRANAACLFPGRRLMEIRAYTESHLT